MWYNKQKFKRNFKNKQKPCFKGNEYLFNSEECYVLIKSLEDGSSVLNRYEQKPLFTDHDNIIMIKVKILSIGLLLQMVIR